MRTLKLPTLRVPTIDTLRSLVLTIGGLGCLTYSAWLAHPIAGFAAAGVSLLVIDWLSRPEPSAR